MESLWLLAIVFVPLAYFDRDYAISEAVIAYVEVPKIALLRSLAGLMAVFWLIDWGIHGGRSPLGYFFKGAGKQTRPGIWLADLKAWLGKRPTRWLILAVWFYLGSTLLGTILSASFSVSLWGEIPGQDGYPAYTILAYLVLFGVIAAYLKTRAQLWRILGAIVVMGVLVSGYAVLQHYGHDFLGLIEGTGGGITRVSSTTGNAIFAAAVMMLSIPLSLMVASLSLTDLGPPSRSLRKILNASLKRLPVASLWVLILTIELMGLTFTFSRGAWFGTLIALVGAAGMAAVFVGWSVFGRVIILLGLPASLTVAVVQLNIPISSPFLWLAALLVQWGVLALAAFLGWRTVGRAALALGLAATLGVAVLLMPSWFRGDAAAFSAQSERVPTAFESRLRSVSSTAVLSGAIAGRAETWSLSWRLMRDHPWFEFDKLSLPWLRPLIGYGPDLFRYTYLLESPPVLPYLLPLEVDHAHNYFIHQGVELGLIGFLSSLGIFVGTGAGAVILARS